MPHTLHKAERLCRKKLIGEMFSGKARSFTCFPLRVVYLPVAEQPCSATILVSVSKRRFKRAVKRNRIKRQVLDDAGYIVLAWHYATPLEQFIENHRDIFTPVN